MVKLPVTDFDDSRIQWVAVLYLVVGFLHGVLDPGISYLGIEVFGRGWEANPIMRIPMQWGIFSFILIHIPLYLGLLVAYSATIHFMRKEFREGKQTVYYLAIFGLVILIGWGLWLNVRNMLVLLGLFG